MRKRLPAALLLLAVAACESAVTSEERGPLPWPAALAEAALESRQNNDGVLQRTVVNVATATGLEHYASALSQVAGAVDRDARPLYVLRKGYLWLYAGIPVPEVPVEEPPPIPDDESWYPSISLIIGPYTLALDAVEVDTETRKVAVYSVWASTVPYVRDGKIWRAGDGTSHPVIQYRVEGLWDGRRWTAEVLDSWGWVLPEYRHGIKRLPGLHRPDFMNPEEPVR